MIRLIKPYISFDDVKQEFEGIFESGMLTKGPYVGELTAALKAFTGAEHAFLASSATTALWVCLKCLGIQAGDEVIVADFSFPATANVVEDLGATPVFADVCLGCYNMEPEALVRLITPRTKAVITVDALGNPTGLHALQAVCTAHGIPLIEDAACAFGSAERGVMCGNIADITCFSFHPRKLLCTGEGGAITTNNPKWAAWFQTKLNHGALGMKGPALDFVDYGYNFRLPELQCLMALKQIPKIKDIVQERLAMRAAYIAQLSDLGFIAQHYGTETIANAQSVVFRVPDGINRDGLIAALKEKEIESTIGTYCLSGTTYYAKKYGKVQPQAQQLFETTITLPCHPDVDVGYVCGAIKAYVNAQKIAAPKASVTPLACCA